MSTYWQTRPRLGMTARTHRTTRIDRSDRQTYRESAREREAEALAAQYSSRNRNQGVPLAMFHAARALSSPPARSGSYSRANLRGNGGDKGGGGHNGRPAETRW